jgi:hypothetical protein
MSGRNRGIGLIGEDVAISSKPLAMVWELLLRIVEILFEVLDCIW